jgi:hypothetical protein
MPTDEKKSDIAVELRRIERFTSGPKGSNFQDPEVVVCYQNKKAYVLSFEDTEHFELKSSQPC